MTITIVAVVLVLNLIRAYLGEGGGNMFVMQVLSRRSTDVQNYGKQGIITPIKGGGESEAKTR